MYLRKILEPETRPEIFIPGYCIGNAAGPSVQNVWVRPPQTRPASNGSGGGTKDTTATKAVKIEPPETQEVSYPGAIVEVKDPFDVRTRYKELDDKLYEMIRPLDRPALEQRVSETKGRLEELEKAREEVNVITKTTFLDIALNPFGRASAAPSKGMEHRAKWLDTQIEQAERDLIVYNGRLDNMIMMEDMAEFSSWTKEEQDAAREHLQWRANTFFAGGSPASWDETEEKKKARDISGLYERYGEDRLEEILESVERDQNARTLREYQDSFDEAAEKGGYWNFLPSVAATAGSGFSNIAGITYSRIHDTGRYSTSDPNHLGQALSMYSQTVTEHNSKNFGKDLLSFLEFASTSGNAGVYGMTVPTSFQPQMYDGLKGTKAQKAVDTIGGLMYTGGKAAADDLVRKGVGALVGGPGGKAITLGLAGIGCFGDSYNAATRKGATPAEATLLAVTDAGVEMLTECIPLDDWWDTVKSNKTLASGLAMDILVQCGIEVTAEELNLIVSASVEYALLRERSEYSRIRNDLMGQGYTREQAERAAFHAFMEDAMETAAVTTVSTGLGVGGARAYGSMTGAHGNTDLQSGSAAASRLPTYQDMNATLEGLRQTQTQTSQTSETAAANSEGPEMDGKSETAERDISDTDSADVPYFTSDHWTGELEGLWTESATETEDTGTADRQQPLRYEDAVRQYVNGRGNTSVNADTALNSDTALNADTVWTADPNAAPVTARTPVVVDDGAQRTAPKPKAQVIGELAPKIVKPGITSGKATIEARRLHAEVEKRYGQAAEQILESFQPGQEPDKFLDGIQNAYFAGKMGSSVALKNSGAAAYLTEDQRAAAFELGERSNRGEDYGSRETGFGAEEAYPGEHPNEEKLVKGENADTILSEDMRISMEKLQGMTLQEQAKELDRLLYKYTAKESRWKGEITEVGDDVLPRARGRKLWGCSILVRYDADIKTKIHELLHARSFSHTSELAYTRWKYAEEAAVELFAREICDRNGIGYKPAYSQQVKQLTIAKNILFPDMSTYDFAKTFFEQGLLDRYGWLRKEADLLIARNILSPKNAVALNRAVDAFRRILK